MWMVGQKKIETIIILKIGEQKKKEWLDVQKRQMDG